MILQDITEPQKHDISYQTKMADNSQRKALTSNAFMLILSLLKKLNQFLETFSGFREKTEFGFLPKCKII